MSAVKRAPILSYPTSAQLPIVGKGGQPRESLDPYSWDVFCIYDEALAWLRGGSAPAQALHSRIGCLMLQLIHQALKRERQ